MFKREMKCVDCDSEIRIPLIRTTNQVKCKKCGANYIITKHSIVMFVETLFMFMITFSLIDTIKNKIVAGITCLLIVYALYVVIDFICIYLLKIKKYERVEKR